MLVEQLNVVTIFAAYSLVRVDLSKYLITSYPEQG